MRAWIIVNPRTTATAPPADSLGFMLRAPGLVERAVRGAVRRWLAPDAPRVEPLDARRLANLALLALKELLASDESSPDPVARHELQGATLAAVSRFARSKLAERLAALPRRRFAAAPPAADALVLGESGALHAVRLEATARLADRVAVARSVATAVGDVRALREPAVHLFSLRDGRLRSFPSTAFCVQPRKRRNGITA
jgi:hypothetical protein